VNKPWIVEEPFETNAETGGERLPFTFNGMVSTPLSIDPKEYQDMAPAAITEALLKQLQDIAPGVSFFGEEAELAAEEIGKANGVGV